jgi:DNA polymerase-3 subunit gamma/tau
VTEWAVAPIPGAAEASAAPSLPTALAVDDEPEEAASELARVRSAVAPAREGDVLPQGDVEPSIEPDDDEREAESVAAPVDAATVARIVAPTAGVREDGVQRYGEAVIRQVLGATFVREEPYEPPTRFS